MGQIFLLIQVLERDCTPEVFAKKRAKIEGKRNSAFSKASYMIAICMKRHAIAGKEMPEWEEVCAVACAVQNMWLSMTAQGAAGVAAIRISLVSQLPVLACCGQTRERGIQAGCPNFHSRSMYVFLR